VITDLLSMMSSGPGRSLAEHAAKMLGESDTGMRSAVDALVPTLLGSMAQKASSPSGAADLFKLVSGANVDTGLMGNIASMLGGSPQTNTLLSQGTALTSGLLGDKAGALATALAGVSNIKPTSAISLLGLVTPMLFSVLKKLIGDGKLDAGGLASLLLGQKGHLEKANVDPRLTKALGFGSLSTMLGALADPAHAARPAEPLRRVVPPPPPPAPSLLRRLLPWLAALFAAFAAWQFLSKPTPVPEVKPAAVTAPATATAPAPAPAFALPASVFFDVNVAAIGDEGRKVIAAAAALAKAGAKIDLTGYTDKTGNAARNEELSKARALAVKAALIAAGAPESAIGMKPPAFVTGSTDDRMARRVDITAQ
jgi:outer membrane protein OmpA-like peptidoglycan-associated protein